MTNQHPITPPLELLQQWWEQADQYQDDPKTYFDFIVTEVAQWGADQELEACVGWLDRNGYFDSAHDLGAARRPKPPSLKEQALLQLDTLNADLAMHGRGCDLSQIRRALEALPE
jgi:hypothetical protein